jgi:hypothetical protein
MKLFSRFVVGVGILLHQNIMNRLNEEVGCDRQSSPPDEGAANAVESGTSSAHFAHGSSENSAEQGSSRTDSSLDIR